MSVNGYWEKHAHCVHPSQNNVYVCNGTSASMQWKVENFIRVLHMAMKEVYITTLAVADELGAVDGAPLTKAAGQLLTGMPPTHAVPPHTPDPNCLQLCVV